MLVISHNVRILAKYFRGNGYNSLKIEERAKYPYKGTYQAFNPLLSAVPFFPGLKVC
jgi:hypothetical protein